MAGQLIQRGERTWLVRVFLGRDSATGKRRYFNKTIHGTKKDARKFLHATLTQIDLGEFAAPSTMGMNEFFDRWLDLAVKPRTRERTYNEYAYTIKRYVRPALGEKRLSEITALDLQTLYADLRERGLSTRTAHHTHVLLANAFKQAVRWKLLSQNPAHFVDSPRIQRREMKAFTQEESKRFLEAASTTRYHAVFMLALVTGLRPEEYIGLKWPDIDLRTGTLTVQRALVWRFYSAGWYISEPKTNSSRRTIPLPASLLRQLSEHKKRQAEERLKIGPVWEHHDFVFTNTVGGPLHPRILRIQFKATLERAGLLTTFRLYDLRHTCATLLLMAGEHPKIVSERLGHSNITITMNAYSHVFPSMQQAATEKLEELLFIGT